MEEQNLHKTVIKKLPQNVIDQIAAGEVIQKPYSVIKELVENSIDAESSQIDIKLKQGGLEQMLIQDNGKGIHPEDFPMLCERFATSKLQNFQGLSSLESFGFRGEALASISYVSDLTITSQTPGSDLGFQAQFKDSKMLQNPEAIPSKKGTIINAQNLFSKLLPRRKSVNLKEEYKNVLKFVMSMSVHHQKVKFILKFDKNVEFQTPQPHSRKNIMSKMSFIPANQFLEAEANFSEFKCKIQGVFSNLSATKKQKEVILFINDRYVFNDTIRKSVEKGYLQCYEGIHTEEGGYYVYLNLMIKHQNVDPNVNPTKKEVKFLFENQIAQEITNFIVDTLKNSCQIKSISQIVKPKVITFGNNVSVQQNANDYFTQQQSQQQLQSQQQKIRNDPKQEKIDQFFKRKQKDNKVTFFDQNLSQKQESNEKIIQEKEDQDDDNNQQQQQKSGSAILRQQLWQELKQEADLEAQEFYQNLTYVGCLSQNYILSQFQTSLYLINVLDVWYDNKYANKNDIDDNLDKKMNSYYNQEMQQKFNEFFELDFIPLLKNQTVFRQMNLKKSIIPVLQLEHIYKYFERC